MSRDCPVCRTSNRTQARFCGRCGEPFVTPVSGSATAAHASHEGSRVDGPRGPCAAYESRRVPPVIVERAAAGKSSDKGACCGGRRSGLLPILILVGLSAVCIFFFRNAQRLGEFVGGGSAYRYEVRDLGETQSQALFQLLKPDDVSAYVSVDGDRLSVRGTRHEIDAVQGLVNLLRRGQRKTTLGLHDSHKEELAKIRKAYDLPRQHAHALARALSFSDWSVTVREEKDRLIISASPEDHVAIESIVKLLRSGKGN